MDELERMLAGELGVDSGSESDSVSDVVASSDSDSESEEIVKPKKKSKNKKKQQKKKDSTKNKKSKHSDSFIETENKCHCGQSLFLIEDEGFYGSASVFCDVCERDLKQNESFFHCMRERNSSHPQGFDVCSRCVLTGRYRPSKFKQSAREEPMNLGSRPLTKRVKISKAKIKHGVDAMVSSVGTVINKNLNGPSSAQQHKNYLDTAFGKEMRESASLREKLVAENKKHLEEIEALKQKLKSSEKAKEEASATIKSVKSQVTSLILKNEELTNKVSGSGPAMPAGGNVPHVHKPRRPQKMTMDPEFKKGLKKMVEKVKTHDKRLDKMEQVMGNMYKLFSSKFEDLSTRMILVETRVNALMKKEDLPSDVAIEATEAPVNDKGQKGANLFSEDLDELKDDKFPKMESKPSVEEKKSFLDESDDDDEPTEPVKEKDEVPLADLDQIVNPLAL